MLLPEQRHRQDGSERVDSYTFNPHKWLFTNFDCNVLWVADRESLIRTLTSTPPYLRNQASASGAVVDYRDWHVPLGRRFRALKLWWVLRHYGLDGLRRLLREHIRLAHELAARVEAHPDLELAAPPSFALTCLRHRAGDLATDAMAAAINAHPTLHVTASELPDGRYVRLAVGQTHTGEADVERLWRAVEQAAAQA
jgi:aromatic-L-amino-acid/L-tryptophan decarboxylase